MRNTAGRAGAAAGSACKSSTRLIATHPLARPHTQHELVLVSVLNPCGKSPDGSCARAALVNALVVAISKYADALAVCA